MKIIQSFWSGNQNNINESYGWYSSRYNWMSWILSCHQLVKYYDKVELYTDDFGYDILINKLQLPYTKVHVILNELDIYPKDLWAIAKIKVYSLQEEPFIHIDGDIFIWEKFPEDFLNSELVAQNLENTTEYYRKMWNDISAHITFIPEELLSFHNGNSNLCCNMGIIGGNDVKFFKKYCEKSFEFINKNFKFWNRIDLFNFNIFFEQELFYALTNANSKEITYLFDEVWDDNGYMGFGDFHIVPHKRTYLHLLGIFKRQSSVCKNMEIYTMKYYPETYSILSKILNEGHKSNREIEFLTSKKISELIKKFETEIKKNQFSNQNFLLKRDLYNQGFTNQLDVFLYDEVDFIIVLLKSSTQKKWKIGNNEEKEIIEIEELNCTPNIYELDEIDIIILDELSIPIKHSKFIRQMHAYLDENDDESKKEFTTLLNSRIMNYIVLKIISIYRF